MVGFLQVHCLLVIEKYSVRFEEHSDEAVSKLYRELELDEYLEWSHIAIRIFDEEVAKRIKHFGNSNLSKTCPEDIMDLSYLSWHQGMNQLPLDLVILITKESYNDLVCKENLSIEIEVAIHDYYTDLINQTLLSLAFFPFIPGCIISKDHLRGTSELLHS